MFRDSLRTRLFDDGRVEIVDPDWDAAPLLRSIDPSFKIRRSPLQNFTSPRFQKARKKRVPVTHTELSRMPDLTLWSLHDAVLREMNDTYTVKEHYISLMDLKIELAKRALQECRLCGRNCGVDRLSGEKGVCGLGTDSIVGEYFVHIAEEAAVNPSLNINLRGCGLKCRFCQQYKLLKPAGAGEPLERGLWKRLDLRHARSISFVGGNPDESVYAILRFLSKAPQRMTRPVIWNANGYGSGIVYKLLDGIVDAYIPDVKFHDNECSKKLAGCHNYFDQFQTGIAAMVAQNVPVFVRLLVLPGHVECCHKHAISYLAQYRQSIKLNLLGQYHPDYIIEHDQSAMSRRPNRFELDLLKTYAVQVGGKDWLL